MNCYADISKPKFMKCFKFVFTYEFWTRISSASLEFSVLCGRYLNGVDVIRLDIYVVSA